MFIYSLSGVSIVTIFRGPRASGLTAHDPRLTLTHLTAGVTTWSTCLPVT